MRNSQKIGYLIISLVIIGLVVIAIMSMSYKKASPSLAVTGIIKDAKTGEPIQGAKVCDGRYADEKLFAVTDSTGRYYFLTYPEEHSIIAEAQGYKTQNQLLTTKAFTKEKERVFDFVLVHD